MESIEKTGATVQEAIDAGMKELGVENPSQVMVEVLQEPDKGIMGEGARPAKVRLLFMGTRSSGTSITSVVSDMADDDRTPISSQTVISSYNPEDDAEDEDDEEDDMEGEIIAYDDAAEDAQVGKDVLSELLEKMDFDSSVEIRRANSTRRDEKTHWILNVVGGKVSRIIGRRGETLASLQYIVRLIVSRRLQRRANIVVDADNYKADRSLRLKSLANRMADQAIRQRRMITLEPMPPHERRIIHLTLRQREDVTTKSVGEGDKRKVTISPARFTR